MIFDKSAIELNAKTEVSSTKNAKTIRYSYEKKKGRKNSGPKHYPEISTQKWIINLNIKAKIMKFRKETVTLS